MAKGDGMILCHVAGCWGAVHSSGVKRLKGLLGSSHLIASEERLEEGESQGTELL